MKKLVLALVMCLGLAGCAEDSYYYAPPATYQSGYVEFCDDWGCRYVNAPYYMVDGEVIYWDVHFGCWIGPRGYWGGGVWHHGFWPGYHGVYHPGTYHHFHYSDRGWKAGSGYHGYHPHGHR